MRIKATFTLAVTFAILVALACDQALAIAGGSVSQLTVSADNAGAVATYDPAGSTESNTLFFQSLGTNGRTCDTCHRESDGWSIAPTHIRVRFAKSRGKDPLFRSLDGATCPNDDVSTIQAARKAYLLLLERGLIRIPFDFPANSEFSVLDWRDPYGCSELTTSTSGVISVYRRPLPTTNLPFETSIMWDGREPDLQSQALNAILLHEQPADPPTTEQLNLIVTFESGTYTAQIIDRIAGSLHAQGASAGPIALSQEPFFIGINDPFGGNPTANPFDADVFILYQGWHDLHAVSPARASILRGEELFNRLPMTISGVAGLNDVLGQNAIVGTCSTCHDTPGVGNHSVNALFDTGVAESGTAGPPLFILHCDSGSLAGNVTQVTDPGRALISGKCADIGKFKVPALRALSARPPYFHDGSAKTLMDVVNFYDSRFAIGFTPRQKRDLAAFLRAL